LSVFTLHSLSAQECGHIYFQHLSSVEGLSQNSVTKILQDDQGFIWLSTQTGLDKYMGTSFRSVAGIDKSLFEQVTLLYDWDEENILMCSNRRNVLVNKWVKSNFTKIIPDTLTNILHIAKLGNKDGYLVFTKSRILKITAQKPNILILQQIANNAEILQVCPTNDHNEFYLATKIGLKRYTFDKDNNVLSEIKGAKKEYTALYHANNQLYFADHDGWVYRLGASQIDSFRLIRNTASITSLLLDDQQTLWVGTQKDGLYLYEDDQLHNKWNTPTLVSATCHFSANQPKNEKSYFSSNAINVIYKSRDGVIWVGANEGGLNIWQSHKQVFNHMLISEKDFTYGSDMLYNSDVWSIYVEPGGQELLAGLKEEGVALINHESGKAIRRLKCADGKGNSVLVIKRLKDTVYLGTLDGLYTFNWSERNSTDRYSPLAINGETVCKNKVTDIEYLEKNKKWVVGGRGKKYLLIFDHNFEKKDSLKLPDDDIFSFAFQEDNGNLIIGGEKGLYRLNIDKDTVVSEFPASRGIHFLCAFQSGDTLWAGSGRKGLFCFSIKDGKLLKKYALPYEEVIYDIFREKQNYLWFSTNHGIYRFNTKLATFNRYGILDGLKVYEYNSGSAAQNTETVELFFGGINGLNYFTPASSPINSLNHKLILQCVYGSKDTFIVDANKIKDHYDLPYKFGYLDLTPFLGYYQDAGNNQFVVIFNGDTLTPSENGHYIITEKEFNRYSSILGGTSTIRILYGNGDSAKLESIKFIIRRKFFSGSNWLLIPLIILLSFIGYLFWGAFKESLKMKRLHQRINEISRLSKTKEIAANALLNLTKDLGYEYATLSFIDLNERLIHTEYIEDDKLNEKQKNYWKSASRYPLDARDILAQVAQSGEIAVVIANKVVNPATFEIQADTLNQDIFQNLKHDHLARMFMPIIHRFTPISTRLANGIETEEGGEVVLGVVEVGYRMNYINKIFGPVLGKTNLLAFKQINITGFLKNEQIRLQLYVDNLAQPYYKAYIKEQKNNLYRIIEDIADLSNRNGIEHNGFLSMALEEMAKRIKADYANVGLRSFNDEHISPFRQDLVYGYNLEQARNHAEQIKSKNQHKIGIINHVLDTRKLYFTGDAPNDDKYQETIPDVRSEIAFPMAINETASLVGVYNFMSKKANYFTQIHAELYLKGVKKITEIYLQKKHYETLQKIGKPSDVFSLTEDGVYAEIVGILRDYFHADYIAVWKRKSQDSRKFLLSREATGQSFYNAYRRFRFEEAEITDESSIKKGGEIKDVNNIKNKRSRIYQFCDKKGFKSYLVLHLISDDKYQAFINVFSKRHIEGGEVQGYVGAILNEIIQKANAVGMSIKVVEAINSISKSFTRREKESPLKMIVDQAYLLAPSVDSVVLFSYTENQDILISDAVVGGKALPTEDSNNPGKIDNVANFIITNGTRYIVDRNMYEQITSNVAKGRPFEQTFWAKRGLKSVAAIRLEFEHKPVGVMLFNYTEKKDFSEGGNNARQFIEAFANFATIALLNDRFIERLQSTRDKISQQLKELGERQLALSLQATQLQKDKEIAQAQVSEAESLMEQILPRAAGASFFLVMQGVNHDIRTLLMETQIDLEDLKDAIPEKHKDSVGQTAASVGDTAQKITNLLKLFDPGAQIVLEFLSISEVVEQVLSFFDKGRPSRILFNATISDSLPDLKCNKSEFSMVIYNLVKNAVQAIPKDTPGEITVSAQLKDKNYHITVKDNGIGIENEKQEHIFDLRYTTKAGGLGIGLYFAKETVEKKLNGKIRVESKKGKGTSFHIEIPLYINYKN